MAKYFDIYFKSLYRSFDTELQPDLQYASKSTF